MGARARDIGDDVDRLERFADGAFAQANMKTIIALLLGATGAAALPIPKTIAHTAAAAAHHTFHHIPPSCCGLACASFVYASVR
jgi:hypothetical protein